MSIKKHFNIGEIVTFKSHPLFRNHSSIKEIGAQVPPLMLVKEVYYDNQKFIKNYSDEVENAQISDDIKYLCVFFNANKSQFEEKMVYNSFLKSYLDLKYFRISESKEKHENVELIKEVKAYENVTYKFGEVVQFKTKKLEHRKSYEGNSEKIMNTSFQTPDFLLSGIKNHAQTDLFYSDGSPKRVITSQLFKVIWFNHFQQKYSEYLLPKEFFVKNLSL